MAKQHNVFIFDHNKTVSCTPNQCIIIISEGSWCDTEDWSNDCWKFTRPEWTVIRPPLFQWQSRCRQGCLLSDWGVLLLDVIMNIAVVIYSRHLSRWRRSELRLFLKRMRPDLPKCVYLCANNLWSSFTYRRCEYKVFLWIFSNCLS